MPPIFRFISRIITRDQNDRIKVHRTFSRRFWVRNSSLQLCSHFMGSSCSKREREVRSSYTKVPLDGHKWDILELKKRRKKGEPSSRFPSSNFYYNSITRNSRKGEALMRRSVTWSWHILDQSSVTRSCLYTRPCPCLRVHAVNSAPLLSHPLYFHPPTWVLSGGRSKIARVRRGSTFDEPCNWKRGAQVKITPSASSSWEIHAQHPPESTRDTSLERTSDFPLDC